jgi:hypothetical protein
MHTLANSILYYHLLPGKNPLISDDRAEKLLREMMTDFANPVWRSVLRILIMSSYVRAAYIDPIRKACLRANADVFKPYWALDTEYEAVEPHLLSFCMQHKLLPAALPCAPEITLMPTREGMKPVWEFANQHWINNSPDIRSGKRSFALINFLSAKLRVEVAPYPAQPYVMNAFRKVQALEQIVPAKLKRVRQSTGEQPATGQSTQRGTGREAAVRASGPVTTEQSAARASKPPSSKRKQSAGNEAPAGPSTTAAMTSLVQALQAFVQSNAVTSNHPPAAAAAAAAAAPPDPQPSDNNEDTEDPELWADFNEWRRQKKRRS